MGAASTVAALVESWNISNRKVIESRENKKGSRYPISWKEVVEHKAVVFDQWVRVMLYASIEPSVIFNPDDIPAALTFQTIYVPFWRKIKFRSIEIHTIFNESQIEPTRFIEDTIEVPWAN